MTVTGTDALGNAGVDATSNELSIVSALPTTFRVSDLIVGASTLFIDFNQPLDVSALNIVDGADASVDAPDVSLIGANVGRVGGSLLWDNAAKRLTFVKTGGVLLPDTYTLTLASRADGNKLANASCWMVIRTILLVATMCEPLRCRHHPRLLSRSQTLHAVPHRRRGRRSMSLTTTGWAEFDLDQ